MIALGWHEARSGPRSFDLLRRTNHSASNTLVELDPGRSQIRSEGGAELLLERLDQGMAKRCEVGIVDPEIGVSPASMMDD